MLLFIKKKVQSVLKTVSGKLHKEKIKFSDRIKNRHQVFWQAPNAEAIRNTIMSAVDPIEQWQNVEHWQRKLSNKYNSREFARKYGCQVADLYWKGRDLNTIKFEELPAHYVIRPTIGFASGLVFLMANGINLMDKQAYSPAAILKIMTQALQENPHLEFLIEEFIRTENGEYTIPNDFKFYMFDGEIAVIQVINRLSATKGYTNFYDQNWQLMPNLTVNYPGGNYQAPPACLPEMIAQAKTLSKAYEIFVRIDFYATDKGVVFGEFTPTPALGKGFTPGANRMLANYWNQYCKGKI